jgi:DNA polymerase/3'-5' exonuclease PolX
MNALMLASAWQQRLRPYCQRIEMAGALRRGRRYRWSDHEARVELVLIPRYRMVAAGAGAWRNYQRDLLRDALLRFAAGKQFVLFGDELSETERACYRLVHPASEILLWTATPDNFGSVWLWRTGSRAHTDWLCERARRQGVCWLPRVGLCTGFYTWGTDEAAIYRVLGMQFVPPERRQEPPSGTAKLGFLEGER